MSSFWLITDKLPYSIKILLESAIRNCDNFQVKKSDVEKIIDWENTSPKQVEIPFKPARVLLQVWSLRLAIVLIIKAIPFLSLFLFFRILLEFQLWLTLHACGMLWTNSAATLTKLIPWYVIFPSIWSLFIMHIDFLACVLEIILNQLHSLQDISV